MFLSTLQHFGRRAFDASPFLFAPAADDPVRERPVDLQSLDARLCDAEALAWPGFMSLHAVRDGADIVDFECETMPASVHRSCCAAEMAA